MDSIKKFLAGFLNKIAYEALRYQLAICLAGITGVITHAYATNNKYLLPYTIILSLSAALGIGFFCIYIFRLHNPVYKIYLKTDFKYVILKKYCTYQYKSYTTMEYKKRIKLKVTGKNIDRYYDKYNWTGYGKVSITSNVKDHKILMTAKRDAFQQLEVYFGKSYKKGDIIEFCLTYMFEDVENKAIPILSTTIVEPTSDLNLKVILPKTFGIAKASFEAFPCIDSRLPLVSGELFFDDSTVEDNTTTAVEWSVPEPLMLLVYSIKWDMQKNDL
ncbi:hypothetical protein [Ruminiclostridium cellobioparum]|uniref:hypothetical protein n=1 Tax=Ruminiclostridium cellobioparum TaxID=29355 RepID=UPI00048A0923|nr:hypothetical protein [Ruminiclostridium cellobioparum]